MWKPTTLAILALAAAGIAFTDAAARRDPSSPGPAAAASPTLTVTLSVNHETAIPGDVLTYTAVVSNSGATAATGVTVSFRLPSGATQTVGPAQDPALNTIAPGASSQAQIGYAVPVPPLRSPGESQQSYLASLEALDGVQLTASASASEGSASPPPTAAVEGTTVKHPAPSLATQLGLPGTSKCLSKRTITIHIAPGEKLAFRWVKVSVDGHPQRVLSGRHLADKINLQGLRKRIVRIRLTALTANGTHLTAERVFHTCAKGKHHRASKHTLGFLIPIRGADQLVPLPTVGVPDAAVSSPVGAVTTEQLPILGLEKSGPERAYAGETVTYSFALADAGLADAFNLNADDALPAHQAVPLTALPRGLSARQTAVTTLRETVSLEPGALTDTASATWTDANGNPYGPISASHTTEVLSGHPALKVDALQKLGDGAFTTSELTGRVGDTVEYEFLVTNTGETPVDVSNASDAHCAGLAGHEGALAPGASATWTCEHKLTAAGKYTNEASIEANDGLGKLTSNTVTVQAYTVGLKLEKLQKVGTSPFTRAELHGRITAGVPGGSVLYVTEHGTESVGKVSVDALGGTELQEGFVSGLPGTGLSGPDSVVVDSSDQLVISSPEAGTISLANAVSGAVEVPQLNKTLIPDVADMAIQPGTNYVWAIGLNQQGADALARVSLTTGETTFMNSDDVKQPYGIVFTPSGRLFVSDLGGCAAPPGESCPELDYSVYELNPNTGQVVRGVDFQSGSPLDALTFDPTTGDLFVAGCLEYVGSATEWGLCQISLGTSSEPALKFTGFYPIPEEPQKVGHGAVEGERFAIDGIAADGKGHIYLFHTLNYLTEESMLDELDIATGAVTPVTEVPAGDDIAPLVGAGALGEGETVNYEIVATNTGEVPLSLSRFEDPGCVDLAGGADKVAPGGSASWICEHTLTEPGDYTNVAKVVASGGLGEVQSNPVTVRATTVGMTLHQEQKIGASPFTAARLSAVVGETVEYRITAENRGEVPVSLSDVTDLACTDLAGGQPELAPGASATWTCQHKLTEAGSYTSVASVTANEGVGARQSNPLTVQAVAEVAPAFVADTPTPSAAVGVPYSYRFRATGVPAPEFTVTSGALPAGLKLNSTTGQLSGEPTETGSFEFIVQAANGANPPATSGWIYVIVRPAHTAPLFTADTPPATAVVGASYNYTFKASAEPEPAFNVASGTLPAGLSLNATSGELSGRPTAAGEYHFSIAAGNGVAPEALTTILTITVAPFTEAPQLTADAPPPGATLATAYNYSFKASGTPTPTFEIASGSAPPGVALNPTSGVLAGTPTAEGEFKFTVSATNGVSPPATSGQLRIDVGPASKPPVLTAASPPTGAAVGAEYSYLVAASGTPAPSFRIASGALPPGLWLQKTGRLAGAPTQTGEFSFSIEAANATGSATSPTLQILVYEPGTATAQDHLYTVQDGRELTVPAPGVLVGATSGTTPLTALIDHDEAHGSLLLAPGGALTYVPPAGFTGTDTFTYQVRDGAGHLSEPATVAIEVTPGGPAVPTLSNISPANDAPISGPTAIKATLNPPNNQSIAAWTVSYRRPNDGDVTQLATGTGPDVAAAFDPTLLGNGTYSLMIHAEASGGGILSSETGLIVEGAYKPGRYEATFEDLSLTEPTGPLTVERTYDSAHKTPGDFGVGWTMNLAGFRVDTNGPLGAGTWSTSPCGLFESQVCYETQTPRVVTITWPDQHVEKFTLTPTRGSALFLPEFTTAEFTPQPGSTATLQAVENELALAGDTFLEGGPLLGTQGLYDPLNFVLTAKNGTKYLLSRREGLLATRDANGNEITIDPTGIHTSSGQSATFNRNAADAVTEIVGPSGTIHYGYSPTGDLNEVRYPNGASQTYTYDNHHNLESISGAGKPLRTVHYNSEGRIDAITDGDGHTTKVSTDIAGHQETITDPLGQLTTVNTYDERGDLVQQEQAFEGKTFTTKATYDAFGHQLTVTDPLGNTTSRTYDAKGDLLSEIAPPDQGRPSIFTYNELGEPTTETNPDGHTTVNEYSDHGDLIASTDPEGHTTRYSYGTAGEPLTETNPEGRTTVRTYGASGALASETAPEGEKTEYVTDPTTGKVIATTNPEGAMTAFKYDADGNLGEIKDALGNTTSFTYDAFDRLTSRTSGAGGTTRYVYDSAGNLTDMITPGGATVHYGYDADGRLVEKSIPGGETSKYTYDPLGRLITAENASSRVAFEYDADGRVTKEESAGTTTSPKPTSTFLLSYLAENTASTPHSVTGPAGETSYSYDPAGQLTNTYGNGRDFQFAYNGDGRVSAIDRPNNVDDTMTYNSIGALTKLTSTSAGQKTLLNEAMYTYDAAGRRTSLTTTGGTARFEYNRASELTSASYPESSGIANESYSYDADGNRASTATEPLGAFTYGAGDRLLTSGADDFTYNAQGDELTEAAKATGAKSEYTWSAENQLTAIKHPDGSTATLRYDPLGRLIELNEAGETTKYAYQGGQIAAEYNGENALQATYQDGGPPPVHHLEMARGGEDFYYLTDGQGSTTALTKATGEIADRYAYGAFGAARKTGTEPNPFTFTGQLYDATAGLQLFRLRAYDPSGGRFLSEDYLAGQDPYVYVGDDAPNSVDPSGGQALSERVVLTFQYVKVIADIAKVPFDLVGLGKCERPGLSSYVGVGELAIDLILTPEALGFEAELKGFGGINAALGAAGAAGIGIDYFKAALCTSE